MAPHKYYTVGVSNQFAAFGFSGGESSDEGEVILSSPPVVESAKESTGIPNYENKSAKKDSTPQKTSVATRGQRPENRMNQNRGGRGGPRRDMNTFNSNNTENENIDAIPRRRGGFRGRGRGNIRGREFDRHSGMGKPRDNAKGGGGGHNWGKEEENAETIREEIRGESSPNENVEEANIENVENTENVEESVKRDDAIDYETYKLMMSERRANLPSFTQSQSQKQITTGKELEAQGYKVHQKEPANNRDTEESDDEHEEGRKKKSISVYEYIQQEGGRVNMFSSRRGRGGRGGGSDERRYFRGGRRGGRSKDAPDIQDTRAFPSLGA